MVAGRPGSLWLNAPMASRSLFLDDPAVAAALDAATAAAVEQLAAILPQLHGPEGAALGRRLRDHLAAMLNGKAGAPAAAPPIPRLVHGDDAFGDPFDLAALPLPRAGTGYAVQMLDTDTLLDRRSGRFLPVRDRQLEGLHPTFAAAHAAARQWISANHTTVEAHPLAIVPASYDEAMQRHILIYGVLTTTP